MSRSQRETAAGPERSGAHAGAIEWHWRRFDELSTHELYAILKLRVDVFVVEQACPYPEIDGIDPDASHLMGLQADRLVAYLRLIPPRSEDGQAALGRIVTARPARRLRIGTELVTRGLAGARHAFAGANVRISAQAHLQDFYRRLGFETDSAEYDEDGIPHVDMIHSGESNRPSKMP